jgi:transketolase
MPSEGVVSDGLGFATEMRRLILRQSKRANVGHIGSALSIVDVIAALFTGVLRVGHVDDPDRDRFILSKGHAALAVYAALYLSHRIDQDELDSYCSDGSRAGVHPEHQLPGIDFSTGSLGHGLPIGAGAALAGRMLASARRVFVLLSDAECNEGSVWEAVMFASHHRLANLVAIVDLNGQQALGYTKDVLDLGPMAAKWSAFGWDVHEVDGHDTTRMIKAIETLDFASGPPHVLLARTVFGKGVSFMESRIKWHYMPMSDDEFAKAISEIDEP